MPRSAETGFLRLQNSKQFALLLATLQSLPCAAFLVDTENRMILWSNDSTERAFGYSADDLAGQSGRVFHVDSKHYDRFRDAFYPVVSAGRPFRGQYWMKRRNGDIFPSAHLISPVVSVGHMPMVVSIICDVSSTHATLLGDAWETLTPKEEQIANFTLSGLTAKEIAALLGISPRTVENHRRRLLKKLGKDSIYNLMAATIEGFAQYRGIGHDLS